MKKRDNIFDCLENAEGSEMEMIAEKTPELNDEQTERILKMSERKYNIKKRNNISNSQSDEPDNGYSAEGVEEYRRPAWMRFTAAAAALVLAGGVIALSHNLLKRRSPDITVPNVPNVQVTTSSTGTGNTESQASTIASADYSASGTDTADSIAAETTSTAAVIQQQSETPSNAEIPVPQTESAHANALSENDCSNVIKQYIDETITYEEIVQTPCREYLDLSDTFTATANVTNGSFADEYANPYVYTIKFVHYTDPKFNTVSDIKNYVVDWADRWNDGNTFDINKMFGKTIVPGQTITYDTFVAEEIFVYTEYNGKIYRGISSDISPDEFQTHEQFYAGESKAMRWGKDHFRNITASSFEDYRVNEGGESGYYGLYRYYYNDGTNWRIDLSKDRELSYDECRALLS